jgi:hypothetical protein
MRAMLGRRRLAVLAALLALLALLAAVHTPQRLPTYDRTSHFAERGVKGADFFFLTHAAAHAHIRSLLTFR